MNDFEDFDGEDDGMGEDDDLDERLGELELDW